MHLSPAISSFTALALLFISSFTSNTLSISAFSTPNSLAKKSGNVSHQIIKMSSSSTDQQNAETNTLFGSSHKPKLPLPEPILSLTPGTWAYDTMTRRIDEEILQRTYEDNESLYTTDDAFAAAFEKFQALRKDLQNAANTPLRHLEPLPSHLQEDPIRKREDDEWREILSPYVDVDPPKTWLSTPWLVAEFYLYRRVIETLDYFNPQSSTYLHDPFHAQKFAGLETSVATAEPILAQLSGGKLGSKPVEDGFALASAFALWGNKMDLSIWPADAEESAGVPGLFQNILSSANDNLLHDDTKKLVEYGKVLKERGDGVVDIIVDNAGFELIMDLALADYLIDSGVAKVVRFQLKSHPTFVSDALEKDLREHVEYYAALNGEDFGSCKQAGERWLSYLDSGKWECNENSFWVQPPPMWDMPTDLRSDMEARCDLAFVKGDANYRRLLGDLQWDFSAPFEDVVGRYFPCPVCALRTLKAEIGCGMEKEKVENAKIVAADNWSTSGRFGVVHFSMGASK
jgi:hypothetical protein